MSDLTCPYCGHGQEVCHDDGGGYAEDRRHEVECDSCEKSYVFKTSISFYYRESKAECLNGAEHRLLPSITYPIEYTKTDCQDCDYRRTPTDAEMADIMTPIPVSDKAGSK